MKISQELHNSLKLMSEGNPEGFTQFYNETYPFVYKRARFIMKNEEDALDLTQETFIQAYKGITSLQEEDKVYSWLSTITYNHGMRLFNKKRDVLVDEEAEEIFDNLVSTDMDTSPEAVAQKKATSEIIKDMIEELPELQKMALLAFYYDNMKIDDIAVMFECSSNTIKSRLNYAKKALQEKVLAHEKANHYRLCSVSPAIILMALDALFATKEYTLAATSASTLLTSTQGTLYVAGAGTTAAGTATGVPAAVTGTSSTAASTVAGAGLSLAAKVTIAVATVVAATGITVGIATGGFNGLFAPPTETEISSEPDTSTDFENNSDDSKEPIDSELFSVPFESVYETQYTGYTDAGRYIMLITEGSIGTTNNMISDLTPDTDIYFLHENGQCQAIHNKDSQGNIKYTAIAPFTPSDAALAVVMVQGNYKNLLMPDGSLLDSTTLFRSFYFYNGYVIATISSTDNSTFNIYDANLNLLKEGLTDFDSIQYCYAFGEYIILQGHALGGKYLDTRVYDKNWNCIDYIAGTDNTVPVYLVLNDTYLWAGDSLRDKNYNEATLPIPDYIHPNGEEVTIDLISSGLSAPGHYEVNVSVTDANGTITSKYFIIDDNFNTYEDEFSLEDYVWLECEGLNVMYDVDHGLRYVAWKNTGEKIFESLDWSERAYAEYNTMNIYGISADLYTDGSILAWVGINPPDGEIIFTTYLLKEEDGYSIDKATNLGVEISYNKGLYYCYNTKQLYLNHTLVDYHTLLFNSEESYYILENNDGAFTVYRSDQTEHFTTTEKLIYSFSPSLFMAEIDNDGTGLYKLIKP